MLATFQGTAFQVSYVLASVAGIIIGAVMLRSDIFSTVAAYALILGDVIGLDVCCVDLARDRKGAIIVSPREGAKDGPAQPYPTPRPHGSGPHRHLLRSG